MSVYVEKIKKTEPGQNTAGSSAYSFIDKDMTMNGSVFNKATGSSTPAGSSDSSGSSSSSSSGSNLGAVQGVISGIAPNTQNCFNVSSITKSTSATSKQVMGTLTTKGNADVAKIAAQNRAIAAKQKENQRIQKEMKKLQEDREALQNEIKTEQAKQDSVNDQDQDQEQDQTSSTKIKSNKARINAINTKLGSLTTTTKANTSVIKRTQKVKSSTRAEIDKLVAAAKEQKKQSDSKTDSATKTTDAVSMFLLVGNIICTTALVVGEILKLIPYTRPAGMALCQYARIGMLGCSAVGLVNNVAKGNTTAAITDGANLATATAGLSQKTQAVDTPASKAGMPSDVENRLKK